MALYLAYRFLKSQTKVTAGIAGIMFITFMYKDRCATTVDTENDLLRQLCERGCR